MTIKIRLHFAVVAMLLLNTSLAYAHSGHGGASGFVDGLMHPLLGWDHLFSAWLIGTLAVRYQASRGLMLMPVFFSMMALGLVIGTSMISVPIAEGMILVSVLMLGLYLFSRVRLSESWLWLCVAISGLAHGQVHWLASALYAPFMPYTAGLIVMTISVVLIGVLHASYSLKFLNSSPVR